MLAYKTGQNSIYRQLLPSRVSINHHARSTSVDAALTLIFKIGQGVCHCLFGLQRRPIICICITKNKSLYNYLTYKTENRWYSIDAYFQNGAASVSLSLLLWNVTNTSFMIVCIQLLPRLPMMQDQTSYMRRWLSCSGWGRQHVSLVFSYNGGRFIRMRQCRTNVNIFRWAVWYLSATILRNTPNTEPEIGTDGSSKTPQKPPVDWYRSRFGPPRCSGSGFWMVQELNQILVAVWPRTAGRLPRPIANTTEDAKWTIVDAPWMLILRME